MGDHGHDPPRAVTGRMKRQAAALLIRLPICPGMGDVSAWATTPLASARATPEPPLSDPPAQRLFHRLGRALPWLGYCGYPSSKLRS